MQDNLHQSSEKSFFERHRWTAKGALIFILLLLLLIPMAWVSSLIYERQSRETEARAEISGKWGGPQTILGPVLSLPVEWSDGKSSATQRVLHFLPEDLRVNGSMQPELRKRGIFEVAVYGSDLELAGHFRRPDVASFLRAGERVKWEKAALNIAIPDLRGLEEQVSILFNGQETACEPGLAAIGIGASGVSATVGLTENAFEKADFSVKIKLKGSADLHFAPIGKSTEVKISAPWADPSFGGAFLPDERTVSSDGFSARWKVLHLNRNYPQVFASDGPPIDFASSFFGASLLLPIDNYAKAERSVKYAALFISLTFLVVFFIEIRSKRSVHPFQYALIGLAMIIFYALLVSISEQLDFDRAYLIASAMTVGLASWFAKGLFGSSKMAAIVGGSLAVLYGFLFTVLQLQDFALLIGTLGLFVILAVVMHFSRKISLDENLF